MLITTYSLRPHCVSRWTAYILQDDTRALQWKVKYERLVAVVVAKAAFNTKTFFSPENWT